MAVKETSTNNLNRKQIFTKCPVTFTIHKIGGRWKPLILYNLLGGEKRYSEIKKEIPEFEIDYKPDFRQAIADSWPASIDDSVAKKDWGLSYDFGISEMTKDMIKNLKIKLAKN